MDEKAKKTNLIVLTIATALAILMTLDIAIFHRPLSERTTPERNSMLQKEEKNVREVKAKELLEAKLDIQERVAKIPLIGGIEIAQAKNSLEWRTKSKIFTSAPFVVTEEWSPEAHVKINDYEVPKPNLCVVEKFVTPGRGEIVLRVNAKWNLVGEKQTLEKWSKSLQLEFPLFIRGNPDGTITFFFHPQIRDIKNSVIEICGEPTEVPDEIIVRDISLTVRDESNFYEVVDDIIDLCDLEQPIKVGNVLWRGQTAIPSTWIKDIIDAGITKRYSLSEWNGDFIFDGSALLWSGIIISAELIVHSSEKQKILDGFPKEISSENGFSLSVTNEKEGIVKITVTDTFMLNFSSLWGV